MTGKPIFRAFKVKSEADLPALENCAADLVLLDYTDRHADEQIVLLVRCV